jgi:hypothetical protein
MIFFFIEVINTPLFVDFEAIQVEAMTKSSRSYAISLPREKRYNIKGA